VARTLPQPIHRRFRWARVPCKIAIALACIGSPGPRAGSGLAFGTDHRNNSVAQKKNWLSGEHFSVDGTQIQAWAGHKSFARKDGDDRDNDGGSGEGDFKGGKRSNETHESKTDPDARLHRKGKTASELRYMGHTLTDNRHGLVVNARVSCADGHAEREAAKVMINDARQAANDAAAQITLGADKGYDAEEFIEACQQMKVTPHVAQNTSGHRSSVPD
jgi:hypothetical protein